MPEAVSSSKTLPIPPVLTDQNGWAELRRLLLQPEQEQLHALQTYLQQRAALEARVADVSEVLPQAIWQRSQQDGQLTQALAPTIEAAIKFSVQKDPRPLVEAVFPVMGPAIRLAIAQAFRGMVQALNRILEYSLSVRGFLWRLEALRSGKSFAEVVLLRTMLYRVEQIFLIHKNTGLLLQHVETSHDGMGDADMISAMLTAIQDFVRDSFHTGATLDTFQVGDVNIWIEEGPEAILAAVIRGTPPYDIRLVFQDTIAAIHREYGTQLSAFNGDAAGFLATRQPLEACLLERTVKPRQHLPLARWGLLALLLAGIVFWQWTHWNERQRWWQYVEQLQETPGIVVTAAHKHRGKYIIRGLRDPLAQDPAALLATLPFPAEHVYSQWEPYYALIPEFILQRAHTTLEPPETITLHLQNGTLQAIGRARHLWIEDVQHLGKVLPGIQRLDMSQVIDQDEEQLRTLSEEIQAHILLFERNTVALAEDQGEALQRFMTHFIHLDEVAMALRRRVKIIIEGHADQSGSEATNMRLSQQRAEHVMAILQQHNWFALHFTPIGKGSQALLRFEQEETAWNRRVSFILNVLPGLRQ